MVDIESYGQLTLSPIPSTIHKIVGLLHQMNVIIRLVLQTHYMQGVYCCYTTKLFMKYRISFYNQIHAKKTWISISSLFCWYSLNIFLTITSPFNSLYNTLSRPRSKSILNGLWN